MARGLCALAALLLVTVAAAAPARAAGEEAAPKVPRFVSLHSDKVNLRTGPGRQYPIEWVLTRRDMPVEIIAEFEHWRRIREWDGTNGWVQEHMVDGKRYVVVARGADRMIFSAPDAGASIVARAEPGAIAQLAECRGPWCKVTASGVTGWLPRDALWGVYSDEAVQ